MTSDPSGSYLLVHSRFKVRRTLLSYRHTTKFRYELFLSVNAEIYEHAEVYETGLHAPSHFQVCHLHQHIGM